MSDLGRTTIAVRDALPQVNDLVRVSVAGSGPVADGEAAEEVPSRVEGVLQGGGAGGRCRYQIAAPRYLGDAEPPRPGTACTLEWPGEHGLWILPVSFVSEELLSEGLRIWVLDTLSTPRQNERRNFVRVSWTVPITLTPMSVSELRLAVGNGLGPAMAAPVELDGGCTDPIAGETHNISEGGVRALVPGPRLPKAAAVVAEFQLAGHDFSIPSRVSWVRPTGRTGPLQFDIAIVFDSPGRHGDRLRPLLFAEQLRIRRAGLA